MPAAPYTCKIGGQPFNVYAGSLNVVNEVGQRSQGSLRGWGPLGVVFQYGTQVQVFDDINTLVYSGFTMKDKTEKQGGARQGTGFLEHNITLMDNAYRADKRLITGSYLLQTAGTIVNQLVGKVLSQEGVTTTPGSVAMGPVIQEVIWNTKRVSEALNWLAKQSGFWWSIDVNNVLHFSPYGGVPAPFVMDGTQADSTHGLSVEFGNDLYVNKEYARGGFTTKGTKASPLDEKIAGDGQRRSFTLAYPVANVYQILEKGVDVTSQSLTKGSTGGAYYFAKGDATIAQDVSRAILGTGDTLEVKYSGRIPVLAVAQNPALILSQKAREGTGSGIVESAIVNTKIHTIAAAFQVAGALLGHYGQDTTVLTFDTRTKGLAQGQMLTVNLPDFALNNRQMLINKVGIDDAQDGNQIWFRVSAVGSPVESAQWQTYWQALMNQSSDPSDFTDVTDTSLAFLLASTVILSWSGTVTKLQTTCPICANSLICNTASPVIC